MLIMLYFLLSASFWKDKWRNLRNTYMKKKKEIRLKKSGQAANKAEKWKFWDVLSFWNAYTEENR